MEFAHNKCFIIIIIIIFIINVEKRIFVTKPQLKSYLQSTCCYKKSNEFIKNTIYNSIRYKRNPSSFIREQKQSYIL